MGGPRPLPSQPVRTQQPGLPPRPADVDLPEALVVPGFVDIHAHGGGGASYTDGNDADILRAAEFHRSHGTTTTLASMVCNCRSPIPLRDSNRRSIASDELP